MITHFHANAQQTLAPLAPQLHPVGHTFYGVLERWRPKVDQQAQSALHQSQLTQQLFVVLGMQSNSRFDLNGNYTLNQQINAKRVFKPETVIIKRNPFLTLHEQAVARQVGSQNRLINRFEQATTEFRVDAERGIDDDSRDFVRIVHDKLAAPEALATLACLREDEVNLTSGANR